MHSLENLCGWKLFSCNIALWKKCFTNWLAWITAITFMFCCLIQWKILDTVLAPLPLQMQFLRVSQLMKLISIWNNKLVEPIVALEIFSFGCFRLMGIFNFTSCSKYVPIHFPRLIEFYHSSLIPVVVVFFKNFWKISCISSAKKMVQTMTEKALHKSKSLGSIILWFLRHLCQDFNL